MNRQTKQLLALAGVLAVGLGAYAALRVWTRGRRSGRPPRPTMCSSSAMSPPSPLIRDGPLSFTLEETGWTWDGDSEFPVNGTELDALREDLAALKAGKHVICEKPLLGYLGRRMTRTGGTQSTEVQNVREGAL